VNITNFQDMYIHLRSLIDQKKSASKLNTMHILKKNNFREK